MLRIFTSNKSSVLAKIGFTGSVALVAVLALIGLASPRKVNVTKAESCSPTYNNPVFNPYPLTFNDQREACKDYPLITGRLTTNAAYPQNQTEQNAGVTNAAPNSEIYALAWVHNGAIENGDPNVTTMKNIKLHASFSNTSGGSQDNNINISVSADNASTKSSTFAVHTTGASTLEIVPGSVELYDHDANPLQSGLSFDGSGNLSLGDQRACFTYARFVRFKVKVVPVQNQNVNLTIVKEVKNVSSNGSFSHTAYANQNDTVEYRIVTTAHGGTARNVIVTDNFPSGLAYVNGTLTVNGQPHATGLTSGLNLGDLADGQSLTIVYRATVTQSSGSIVNTATSRADNASQVQDTATVIINNNPTSVVCTPSSQSANVNQAVYFTASGGNGNFSWSASNGNPSYGNGSSFTTYFNYSGNFTVTVNSNGQTASCNVQVNQINNAVYCTPNYQSANVNQTVYFTASGGNGNFYWSAPGATQTTGNGSSFSTQYYSSGNYNVTVSSNGQTANCSVQVNQIYNNQVVCNPSSQNVSVNQLAYFSANGGNGSYSWQASDGSPSYGNGSSFSTSFYNPGSRYVTVTSGGYSATCYVNVNGVLGGNTNLNYSKRAWNDTKNQDATVVRANLGDTITYTLTVNNTGNSPATNFVVSDDLSQVLDKADIVDNGGGTLNGNTISFPGTTVPVGGSVTKSFRVKVKTNLAANQTYTMTNTYGNTINILIGSPTVLGAFTAPKTGAAGTSAVTFAGLMTLGFVGYKKRKALSQLILN